MSIIRHIYIHIPFCNGKCSYCNFYSETPYEQYADSFLAALKREMKVMSGTYNIIPATIYIGGGTPLLLSDKHLEQLLRSIHSIFNTNELKEWTVEGNPNCLSNAKIKLIRKFGVTRISLGAQSMDDSVLHAIGRRHTAEDTRRAALLLHDSGFKDFGLDLIACLPGVNRHSWQNSVQEIIELKPTHISVYALSLEPGSQLAQSDYKPAPPREEQFALQLAEESLGKAGYQHYEVSNYAQDGFACKHNTAVWQGADFIGFGPAAASRIQLLRRTNKADLKQYCSAAAPGTNQEILNRQTDAVERFMFTFRMYAGVNPRTFAANHGPEARLLLPFWLEKLRDLKHQGLVDYDGTNWALTKNGRSFADTVAEAMIP